MTETETTNAPQDGPAGEDRVREDRPAPAAGPPPETGLPRPRRTVELAPFAYVIGAIVLVVALIFLWKQATPGRNETAALQSRLDALQRQVQALSGQVAALASRPVPAPPDLTPLANRIATLEKRPAAPTDGASRSDLDSLNARLDALGKRLDGIEGRIQTADGGLGNQLAALTQRMDALTSRVQSGEQALTQRVDAVETRLSAAERAVGQVPALADRATRLARLQAAVVALNAGEKLGQIPDAPPALARFADTAPPTEAELRLSFPAAAEKAEAASRPDTAGKPFLDRVWAQVQRSVTVRQGDHVIVGDPAAGILAEAQHALDAGDLEATVSAVEKLEGPAADAMSGWLARAKSLLAARAALAEMAAHA